MAIMTPVIYEKTMTAIQLKLITDIVIDKTHNRPIIIGEDKTPYIIPKNKTSGISINLFRLIIFNDFFCV